MDELEKDGKKLDYNALQNPAFSEALFQLFMQTKESVDAFAAINNAFYLQAGEHELGLIVEASGANERFEKCWHFFLTEDDIDNLRRNAIPTLRQVCGLPTTYNFAFPEYKNGK